MSVQRMCAILILAILPVPSIAQWVDQPHSRARLIAGTEHLIAGQDNWIALQVEIDPEWHVYWQNPGDSGAAPILALSASAPIAHIGPLYPMPKRISVPPLETFGYEKRAVYLFKVNPKHGASVLDLKLEAEWLVCKVSCIPALATLVLRTKVLPLGRLSTASPNADVIKKAIETPAQTRDRLGAALPNE